MSESSLQEIINTEAAKWSETDIEAIVRGLVEQSNQWNQAKAAGQSRKPASKNIKAKMDLKDLLG